MDTSMDVVKASPSAAMAQTRHAIIARALIGTAFPRRLQGPLPASGSSAGFSSVASLTMDAAEAFRSRGRSDMQTIVPLGAQSDPLAGVQQTKGGSRGVR